MARIAAGLESRPTPATALLRPAGTARAPSGPSLHPQFSDIDFLARSHAHTAATQRASLTTFLAFLEMSASNIIGNRNSTPEASQPSLRPPSARISAANGQNLRASADMSPFTPSPLSGQPIRPSSEVYYSQSQRSQNQSHADEAMDKAAQQWIADIDQYETTLEEMATATLDQDFKDELSAIEQWFKVLSEAERTAALYALLQQTTQVQTRFFVQVLQEMAKGHPMSGVLSSANFGDRGKFECRCMATVRSGC